MVNYTYLSHVYRYTVKPVLRGHIWGKEERKNGLLRQVTS